MSRQCAAVQKQPEYNQLEFSFSSVQSSRNQSHCDSAQYISFYRQVNSVDRSVNCCFSRDVLLELGKVTTSPLQEVMHQISTHSMYQLRHRRITQITAFFKRISKAIVVTVNDSADQKHITIEFVKE